MSESLHEGEFVAFGLAIRLKMVRRSREMLHADRRVHQCEELCCELGAIVGADAVRYPVRHHPPIDERV